MAKTTNNTAVQAAPAAAPATGHQDIRSGDQVIQRPTVNTSTESTLKEAKK